MATVYDVRDGSGRPRGPDTRRMGARDRARAGRLAQPQRIILLGSVGRGDDGPDSDIDLMVVLSELDYVQRRELSARLRSGLTAPLPIQLFLTDERECKR